MSTFLELVIDQGATFKSAVRVRNDLGQSVNLSSYVMSGSLRRSYSSGNTTANITINLIDSSNGIIQFEIANTVTANISANRYVFDIYAVGNGEEIRLFEGMATVTPSVTR